MNAKGSSRRMIFGNKMILAGSIVALIGAAALGAVFFGNRPAAPPASDPNAGRAAAEFCVRAIGDAIIEERIEASQPEPARRLVRAIEYTNDAVRVIYSTQSGQSFENVEYDVAVFITSLFSESSSPAWKIFGKTSEPFLRCTQAVQYFEQEKAKDVARELQNWVFGPPAPRRTLEGSWTFTRTITACENLEEGCASGPIVVAFLSCSETRCLMSRDGVWRTSHPVTRTGEGIWTAQFEDIAFACSQTNPQTLNPGSYTMSFSVDDAAETMIGTVTYTATTNPPCRVGGLRASYDFVGKRS